MTKVAVDEDMVKEELKQIVEISVGLFESNAEMSIKAKTYSRIIDLTMGLEDWPFALAAARRLKEVLNGYQNNSGYREDE